MPIGHGMNGTQGTAGQDRTGLGHGTDFEKARLSFTQL